MSNTPSPKQSSSEGSGADQFIRVVEQLIDTDEDELLAKRILELHPHFPILKRMNPSISNQEKLHLFFRDQLFKNRLTELLKEKKKLFADPIIKLYIYTVRYRTLIQEELDSADIQTICEKFGTVQFVYLHEGQIYIWFDNHISAYLALRTLNDFEIQDSLRLGVKWPDLNDQIILKNISPSCNPSSSSLLIPTFFTQKSPNKKITSRYDIFIDANIEFRVAKRIIGPGGANMKKIFEKVASKCNIQKLEIQSIAKIRLRGKGSGFIEGPNGLESDEMLNLCVSCKDEEINRLICQQLESLLQRISKQYQEFYQRTHKKHCEGVSFRKYQCKKNNFELIKQFNLEQINPTLEFIQLGAAKKEKIKEKDIVQIIQNREKARKLGRFQEADQMRQKLKKEGVSLIDVKENGKKFRTTWKFTDD